MIFFQKQTNKQKLTFFPTVSFKNSTVQQTPFFYTNIDLIKKRYQELEKSLNSNWSKKHIIAFSFKTNYEVIDKIKKEIDISAEIVSEMEYTMTKEIKFPNSKIIYNGPNKANLLKVLSQKDTIVNIDNQSELDKIIKNKNQIKCQIGIRLNSNLKKSRFGFNMENSEAQKTINLLKKEGVQINGLHIHLGFFTPPKIYHQISKRIIDLIRQNDLKLKYIDFGGGFPSHGLKPYGFKKYTIPSINEYISQICSPLNIFYKDNPNKPTLIIEPGRFLVDDSTIFVTKIIHSQNIKNQQTIIVDATNQMLSSVWFRPQIINCLKNKKNQKISTIIYGSSCQENDILYQGKLPYLKNNDLVYFYCVGAYNQNMGNNFIFPKPQTIYSSNLSKNQLSI